MAPYPISAVSICSGIEGIGKGLAKVIPGLRVVLHIERECSAAAILAARMADGSLGQAAVWSDLATADGAEVGDYLREATGGRGVDIVFGGIPCQGNSLAGKRGLEDDPRNLWPATRRFLRAVGAEWFFLENVYGLLVPERGERHAPISRILGELSEDGWNAEWAVVSASDIGASQQRERVFLLAHRTSGLRERHGRGLLATKARSSRAGELDGDLPERPESDGSALELASGKETGRSGIVQHDSGESAGERVSRRGHADGCDSPLAMASSPQRGRGSVRQPSGGDGLADGSDGTMGAPKRRRGRKRQPGERASGGIVVGGAGRTGDDEYAFDFIDGIGAVDDGGLAEIEDALRAATARKRREMGGGGAGLPQRGSDGPVQPGTGEPGQGEAAELRDGNVDGSTGPRHEATRERTELREQRGGQCVLGERRRDFFGPFPPGPGFGLDRVAESVLADLEAGKVGADDRFLAELAEWAKWQVVLERRPDLAPAISEDEQATLESRVRDLAHGLPGKLVSRADELRALGNAVVPLQAAVAFLILFERLMEN